MAIPNIHAQVLSIVILNDCGVDNPHRVTPCPKVGGEAVPDESIPPTSDIKAIVHVFPSSCDSSAQLQLPIRPSVGQPRLDDTAKVPALARFTSATATASWTSTENAIVDKSSSSQHSNGSRSHKFQYTIPDSRHFVYRTWILHLPIFLYPAPLALATSRSVALL